MPILTTGFYNIGETLEEAKAKIVVMPILTTGFYNFQWLGTLDNKVDVVMPILTTGFYNPRENYKTHFNEMLSCLS